MFAAWEGHGTIECGNESDAIVLKYSKDELVAWIKEAGYLIDQSIVELDKELSMEAIYLEGTKQYGSNCVIERCVTVMKILGYTTAVRYLQLLF